MALTTKFFASSIVNSGIISISYTVPGVSGTVSSLSVTPTELSTLLYTVPVNRTAKIYLQPFYYRQLSLSAAVINSSNFVYGVASFFTYPMSIGNTSTPGNYVPLSLDATHQVPRPVKSSPAYHTGITSNANTSILLMTEQINTDNYLFLGPGQPLYLYTPLSVAATLQIYSSTGYSGNITMSYAQTTGFSFLAVEESGT